MNEILKRQIENLLDDNIIGSLNNVAAAIYYEMGDINWAGYYFFSDNLLKLGPFVGKVACSPLKLDKGVCAKSFNTKEVVVVKNVHDFIGHIACDSASNSEIVLPIYLDNKIIGVLDIDSPIIDRFKIDDIEILKEIATLISKHLTLYHLKVSSLLEIY